MKINTYYHGGGNYDLFHNGVLWLTDSKEYAEDYALGNKPPVLYTITIDESQMKCCASSDYVDDAYGPSMSDIQAILNDGYNCYELVYEEDDCFGIALLSKKPIIDIKREIIITEQDLHRIFRNSVNEVLNENGHL